MNVNDIIINDRESINWDDVFMDKQNRQTINNLLEEYQFVYELQKYNLPCNNKILLHGSSGCGKTTTAKAIAHSLGKSLHILNLSNIVCSRIGETSQNLKMIFDKSARENSILFLDEFDQIGKMRGNDDKDVGEMRRLVNTLIQLIDYLPQKSLLIAATNQIEIIDKALIRRFQCVIEYQLPDDNALNSFYDKLLLKFPQHLQNIERRYAISYAEAKDYAYTIIKTLIIKELKNKLEANK